MYVAPTRVLALLVALLVGTASRAVEPPDALSGPPFVSCRSWAIIDGATGELLWGHEHDTPRKSASTTKVMCAYVVLELAKRDPNVLDEVVTFSQLADETPGSTADVRQEESLSARECLYGLLLPSGNDAGNALAEHFNDRFAPPEYPPERTTPATARTHPTRANFIAEMNRTAGRLGMTRTFYRSSYGDGGADEDRTTTARDLLRLAWTAMQEREFRKRVSTAKHETTVATPEGGTRPVVWENTNQLLGISGYDGVKTGTTDLAGTCLVSSAHRGDDHLMLVVLGSTSNEGRYVDSRNLYRWAWLQRGHGNAAAGK
jgi:D-alanyl-D-alanine carboxypeptidase (penicillin-binding protein 5/6)